MSLVLNKLDRDDCGGGAVPKLPHELCCVVMGGPVHPEPVPQSPTPLAPIMLVVDCRVSTTLEVEGCAEVAINPEAVVGAVFEVEKRDRISSLTSFLGCSKLALFCVTETVGTWKSRLKRSPPASADTFTSVEGFFNEPCEAEVASLFEMESAKLADKSWCIGGWRAAIGKVD